MALKDRLEKKTTEEKVDDEIQQEIEKENKSAKKSSKQEVAAESAAPEPEKQDPPKGEPYGDGKVMMATRPEAPPVDDEEARGIMEDVMLGLSARSTADSTRIEAAIKTLLNEGGLSAVKDLLSQIKKPRDVKAQFGDKWSSYPVAHIVALETVVPNPSISRFRVGGHDQNSYQKGKEFDVPLPVARYLSDKGVAAILSTSE